MEFDISLIEVSINDKKRNIKFPNKFSNELAEFLGVLTGDGYMNHYNPYSYMIEIAGDKRLDKNYLKMHVSNLIWELFNFIPTVYIRKDQNTIYLRILSKGIFNFLTMVGFKNGRKEQIEIPKWVLKNDKYMFYFIRGLADTDYSLMLMNKSSKKSRYYPIISFSNKSKVLIKEVGKYLKNKEFKISYTFDYLKKDKRGYNDSRISKLIIAGRKNLDKWMNSISFRNSRHLDKYKKYQLSKNMGTPEFESGIQDDTHGVVPFT